MLRYLTLKDWCIGLFIAAAIGFAAGGGLGIYAVLSPYAGSGDRYERERKREVVREDMGDDGEQRIRNRFFLGFIGGSVLGLVVAGATLKSTAQARAKERGAA